MITKKDLRDLYEWGKQTKFPLKKAPTIDGYSNIDIDCRMDMEVRHTKSQVSGIIYSSSDLRFKLEIVYPE